MQKRVVLGVVAVLALVGLVVLGACGKPPSGPTYHKDIAPLFASQCAECHQPGGIGPFSLVTYADAQKHAAEAAFAVGARLMPPSNVDASGKCRTYQDSRWLSDAQIKLVKDWADAGAPEGDDDQPAPALPHVDALDDANVVADMPVEYAPQGSAEHPNDDYRCFIIDGADADSYVTGFEIVPGQPQEVHHMILVATLDQETEDQAQALDDADERPGFECFSNVFDGNIAFLAGWAPGKNTVRYPKDTGIFVVGGRKMIMQIHYNLLAGPGVPDRTSVKLTTVPSVPKEATVFPVADDNLDVPPGLKKGVYSFSQPLAGITDDLDVYGVFPHMHTLGQTLEFGVHPINDDDPADDFCMTSVWRWDFHWQQLFLYDDPIRVKASDVLHVACSYDTSHRSTDVVWGEGTQDEMCLVGVYVARPNGGPLADLIP